MKLVKTFGDGAATAEALIEGMECRGAVNTAKVDATVRTILAEVRQGGIKAVVEYAGRFDGLRIAKDGSGGRDQSLRVSREEMKAAWEATDETLKAAMQAARANILAFAERQMPKSWTFQPVEGVETGQVVRPLSSVGCYVPGGRYPLPSTLLMTVTPAQVAGVERIVVCSPKPAAETMAAGWLAGVTEFYCVGGAQAVALMAYGAAAIEGEDSDAIEPVDKIVGPGNLYVTAAKMAVSGTCGIDMPAGPTEIVVTSETGDPAGIAADLVAQAEHDPEALPVMITSNEELAKLVAAEVKRQAAGNAVAEEAIAGQGVIFVTRTVRAAQELTNRLAPEHLSVDEGSDVRWVQNAGSVFVGRYTPQTMGDYVSGPNHVLPTGRNGRVRGGLSVMDFVKVITVQRYTRAGLERLGPHAIALAEAEGLAGHAESVRVRLGLVEEAER